MTQTHAIGRGGDMETLSDGVIKNNPVVCQVLGICSALAVTASLSTTLVMSGAVVAVAMVSAVSVSLLRKYTPFRVRLLAQMLIIATPVIVIDLFLSAYWPDMRAALSVYLSLVITNCLILGRCEGFAMNNGVWRSLLDGVGMALGYALVLCLVAIVRESLGAGTLLGVSLFGDRYVPIKLLALFPGAFLTMGIIVWVVKAIWLNDRAEGEE